MVHFLWSFLAAIILAVAVLSAPTNNVEILLNEQYPYPDGNGYNRRLVLSNGIKDYASVTLKKINNEEVYQINGMYYYGTLVVTYTADENGYRVDKLSFGSRPGTPPPPSVSTPPPPTVSPPPPPSISPPIITTAIGPKAIAAILG